MFIPKMLESDWLDNRTWTIYTFPYRRSGPFIRLSIKVKTQDFWEDDREVIDRGREKLVAFGKLSVNFQKLSGKTWSDSLLHFQQSFLSVYIQNTLSRACSEYFSPCGRSIRQDLGLYIFPYGQSNQLLRR